MKRVLKSAAKVLHFLAGCWASTPNNYGRVFFSPDWSGRTQAISRRRDARVPSNKAGGDACVPGQALRAGLRGAYDLPYSVFGDAVFGGYFGIDKHGRHTAKCKMPPL